MHQIRREKILATLQDEVRLLIPGDLRDPRLVDVTVSRVELTEDGQNILIHFSLPQDLTGAAFQKKKKEVLAGLESASGYVRNELASVLQMKKIPNLAFKEDKQNQSMERVNELLKQIESEKKKNDPERSGTD